MLPAIVLLSSSFLAAVAATTSSSSSSSSPPSFLASVAGTSSSSSSADDCVLDLAIVCLDDKVLVYVNWLEKRDKLNVVGDIVTIVKKQAVRQGLAQDRSKLQQHKQHKHQRVSTSLGPAIDEYFDTHTLRISLPWILDDDIDLELDQEGRGKKPKLKKLKKLMSLLGVIMCAKLSLMGPLAMVMIGAKALKALILAVVSLTISKLMLLKKFKGGGHGGGGYGGGGYGGGGYGGSVVQADWSSDKDDRNAHLLAYNGQSTAIMSPSSQQPQLQNVMYPSYESNGYHRASA